MDKKTNVSVSNCSSKTKIDRDKLLNDSRKTDIIIGVFVLVFSVIALLVTGIPVLVHACYYNDGNEEIVSGKVIFFLLVVAILFAIITFLLYLHKNTIANRLIITNRQFFSEQKKNQILKSVFQTLIDANYGKIRGTLRNTYGSVLDWNPINYDKNRLVYDVHDHIRYILLNIKKVVISIDPERFSEKNVSVDLVCCYPEDNNSHDLPLKSSQNSPLQTKKRLWKLISTGDFSGNHSGILNYLENSFSFYKLVECFGSYFANNKYEIKLSNKEKDLLKEYLTKTKGNDPDPTTDEIKSKIEKGEFFIENVKDHENTKYSSQLDTNKEYDGSVIGTVICVRNDNPEHILVKAILTVNTYGEPIFLPNSIYNENGSIFDKFGLQERDYQDLFMRQVIQTYSALLASELSQMYIRHLLKSGRISSSTGRLNSLKYKIGRKC